MTRSLPPDVAALVRAGTRAVPPFPGDAVSSPVCDRCGSWIEVDNRAFAGYCSTDCRQHARIERDCASAASRNGEPTAGNNAKPTSPRATTSPERNRR